MHEIWKDVSGHEGRHQVSDLGRVRSINIKVETLIRVITNKTWSKNQYA